MKEEMRTKEEIEQEFFELNKIPITCLTEGLLRMAQLSTLDWVLGKRENTNLDFELRR